MGEDTLCVSRQLFLLSLYQLVHGEHKEGRLRLTRIGRPYI